VLVHELKPAPKILLLLVGSHRIETEMVCCFGVLTHIVKELFGLIVNFLTACKQDSKFILIEIALRALLDQLSCDYFVFYAS